MERLPILKGNTSLMELLGKLPCETNELAIEITRFLITNRIPDRDNAARETLDVLQLAMGILDILSEQGADIPALLREHEEKLISRGWEVKRYIPIDWRGEDERNEGKEGKAPRSGQT